MFGAFRLILAAGVAGYHAGMHPLGVQQGVMAVVCFYVLSGFVMAALLERHYPRLDRHGLLFYADRAMRILPQYLGVLVVTAVCIAVLPIDNARINPGDLTPATLAANLAIVPLNYSMLVDIPRIVQPSWSLAAEIQFYVLAPVLVHLKRVRAVTLGLSAIVLVLAACGWLDSEVFGYRVLPGVLCFFLTGAFVYEARQGSRTARQVLIGLALGAGALWVSLWWTGRLPWLTREILGGYLVGLLAVSVLAGLRSNRLDNALGNAAYGTFLGHWLVIWLLERYRVLPETSAWFPAAVIAGALTLGFVSYWLFERPVVRMRRRLRINAAQTWPSATVPAANLSGIGP